QEKARARRSRISSEGNGSGPSRAVPTSFGCRAHERDGEEEEEKKGRDGGDDRASGLAEREERIDLLGESAHDEQVGHGVVGEKSRHEEDGRRRDADSARWHDDAHDRLDAGCAIHERLLLERTRNGAKGESTDDGPERSLRERVQDSDGRGGSDEVAEKMAFAEDADPRRRRDVERNERSENEKGLRDAT